MSTIKITYELLVTFDDGSQRYLEIPERVYYYHEQKRTYWVRWIEDLIEKEQITAKPIRIEEVNNIIEVEPYNTIIGL